MARGRKFRIFRKDKRRASDRRRKVDPRYRNPNYPDFVEQRSGRERRQAHPTEETSFLHGGSTRPRTIVTFGLLAVFLLCLFFFLCVSRLSRITPDQLHAIKKALHPIVSF